VLPVINGGYKIIYAGGLNLETSVERPKAVQAIDVNSES
jgi:hypothetical protein